MLTALLSTCMASAPSISIAGRQGSGAESAHHALTTESIALVKASTLKRGFAAWFSAYAVRVCLVYAVIGASMSVPSAVWAKSVGLVVTGIGGNDTYAEQFEQQGIVVVDALRTVSEVDADIVLLQAAQASREAVLEVIASQAERDGDLFILVLLGHGTLDAESWRFNVAGEDITTDDLVAALNAVNTERQVVIVGTSASGAVLDVLSQPGRHVITATKSGGEVNAVRFPEYLAKALESAVADTDRNEILTLAEVYRYANEQTQAYYEDQKLLASEHARLTGDQASRIALARLGALRTANDNPVVAQLLDERLILEDTFLALKARKASMQTAHFYEELEPLLLSIARLQKKIDAATGWVEANE